MKEKDYCKLISFGLANLLSFLFSIVILTSAYNNKTKIKNENSCYINSNLNNIIDNL